MKQIEVLKEVEIDELLIKDNSKTELNRFMDLIKDFNITDIEPLLDEDVVFFEKFGKYHFLASLRDIFIAYKEFGDSKIILTKGACSSKCFGESCPVYQLKGNKSEETIAFVVEEKEEGIKALHPCGSFIDANGNEPEKWVTLLRMHGEKLIEMLEDEDDNQ